MLYSQIADMITRTMKKQKESNLFNFLKEFNLTSLASEYFKKDLSFNINTSISQRKLVDLGKILARIVCVGYVLELADKGYRQDLVDNSIEMVKQEVATLFASFHFDSITNVIEDYQEKSSWLDFA